MLICNQSSVKTESSPGVPLTSGKSNGPASLLVGPFPFSLESYRGPPASVIDPLAPGGIEFYCTSRRIRYTSPRTHWSTPAWRKR